MTTPRRAIFRSFLFTVCMLVGAAQAATSAQVAEFFRAVQTDDARTVKSMLAGGFDANSLNPIGGEPALVLAAREGSMQVLDALLAHAGTRIDTPAVNGNTALMMAAFKHNMPAVQALLAKGAAVNRDGWTPLHYAAAGGDNEIARLLLKHGASIDALSPRASGAYTPLMMAAREGHDSTALQLIDSGANPRLTNSEGLTPAQLAERAGKTQVAAAIAARAARH